MMNYGNITYRWSFEIHGDLEKVWRCSYQPTLPKSGYKKRTQSRDPAAAPCQVVWKGMRAQTQIQTRKSLGKKVLAEKILIGLPMDSDDEEDLNEEEEEEEEIPVEE